VTSSTHQVSQPCYRNSSGIHFDNVKLVAESLCCIAFTMVWRPFLLQLTFVPLQPTPDGPKPDIDRFNAIQTHTAIPSFLPQFTCEILYHSTFANCRQTPLKLNSTQSSCCKCLLAWFLSSALHGFYLFIVISICYHLHHCFHFMHLDPPTAVRYYST